MSVSEIRNSRIPLRFMQDTALRHLAAFDVLRQLAEGLITEFDRAESDNGLAL